MQLAAKEFVDTKRQGNLEDRRTARHWYDFICPFCYIAQDRNELLTSRGVQLLETPFQAHPEIPAEGVFFGQRSGPMYARLEVEAKAAGLPLNWPPRLPNTRRALAVAEWVRQNQTPLFQSLQRALFAAHFAFGEDLGDVKVLDKYVIQWGVDLDRLHSALEDGSALELVAESEDMARKVGVRGTPAWFIQGELINGLLSRDDFLRLAEGFRN